MRTIKLPIGGVVITLGEIDRESPAYCYISGNITSELHETCHCGSQDCEHEDSPRDYNIAIDVIESFLLALAVAGVDVEAPGVQYALETALEKMAQQYDT
jgi:hypothetical protein